MNSTLHTHLHTRKKLKTNAKTLEARRDLIFPATPPPDMTPSLIKPAQRTLSTPKQSLLLELPAELQLDIFFLSANCHYPEVHPRIFELLNAGDRPQLRHQLDFLFQHVETESFSKLRREGLSFVFFDVDTLEALEKRFIKTRGAIENLPDEQGLPRRLIRMPPPERADEYKGPGKWRDPIPLIEALLKRRFRPNVPQNYPIIKAVQDGNVRLCRTLLKSTPYAYFLIDGDRYKNQWKGSARTYGMRSQHPSAWQWPMAVPGTKDLQEKLLLTAVAKKDFEMLDFLCNEVTVFKDPRSDFWRRKPVKGEEPQPWPKCGSKALARAVQDEWWQGVDYLGKMGAVPDLATLDRI